DPALRRAGAAVLPRELKPRTRSEVDCRLGALLVSGQWVRASAAHGVPRAHTHDPSGGSARRNLRGGGSSPLRDRRPAYALLERARRRLRVVSALPLLVGPHDGRLPRAQPGRAPRSRSPPDLPRAPPPDLSRGRRLRARSTRAP